MALPPVSINATNGTPSITVNQKRFSIQPPRSIVKFIILPSLWSVPNFKNFGALLRRIKTNFLYFQTNYLILTLCLFAVFMILSMKTLLTGVVSAMVIGVAVLFFFEHIPQARQIKQNYPTLVIVAAPLPLWFLHAAFRSTEGLIGTDMGGNYFVNTPVGQIMQMFGIEPKACLHEH